ncbi:hypothetical protein A2450_04110 [candidate division WWE3 bacterium RIFOXYC2_FULL_40_11]|nr:MAG: hypothetical protein A2450_04110 [candidate division WWE3 bacterium RIFOXYC2_FULL_40_11]
MKKSQEEAEKKVKDLQNGVVLDTSVLIDGRILDIAKTGFLDKNYIVPQCVLAELHTLSDSKDSIKRQRGRRGLDVANKLKKYGQVTTIDDVSKVVGDVDKKVTMLAKDKGIPLMTLDFNLNKVASISGVKVLNINELVDAIKTVLLPGENVIVEIVNQGKTNSQGIGYLGDGTMIVVDGARDKVGQEVAAKVKKVIQSKAGRMIFCEISQ